MPKISMVAKDRLMALDRLSEVKTLLRQLKVIMRVLKLAKSRSVANMPVGKMLMKRRLCCPRGRITPRGRAMLKRLVLK